MTGLGAGLAAGHGIEGERRRRNFQENNPGVDYDAYKQQSDRVWKRQKQLLQDYPEAARRKAALASTAGVRSPHCGTTPSSCRPRRIC